MKRRTFLKTAATFSAVSVLTPSFTLANEEKIHLELQKPRKFEVKIVITLNKVKR